MIATIFRVAVIFICVSVTLAVLGSVTVLFNVTFQYSTLLTSFLKCACYILPFKQLLPVFVCIIGLLVYKISVSIIDIVWKLLPIRG